MTHNWIPTVLRARQAQEDLLAQGLAVARRDAGRAADQHAEQVARVEAMVLPQSQSVPSFHATLAVQQAAAATLAAARNRVLFAESRVAGKMAELTAAARSRRTVEKLHERHQDEQALTASGIEQRELDEVSIGRHATRLREVSQ
ncbi:MAG TPA: flagellar FliJ family protein [Jatrophihabitans sp.]|jgi:flagellar export protein FliJ|nr:flagellar FliJ family protein [Jatrophihabitans sp.]